MTLSSRRGVFYSFSRAIQSQSDEFRPERAKEMTALFEQDHPQGILSLGNAMSYNDSGLNHGGAVLNPAHFNHFLHFDKSTGVVRCQSAVKLHDLFQLNKDYMPAVVPGTLQASVGGAIAHDVHGKNQYIEGSFGHHLQSFKLNTGSSILNCNREENTELFKASVAGLGLTGFFQEASLKLIQSPQVVEVSQKKYSDFNILLSELRQGMGETPYQAAWLDLLNAPKAILLQAHPIEHPHIEEDHTKRFRLPPIRLIYPGLIKQFNRLYFHASQAKSPCSFIQFNQPLEKIQNWNRLYGRKGLIQFQGLFPFQNAEHHLAQLLDLIKQHQASPCLAVLKTLGKKGEGYLSFCQPGFTLAIDFIHNQQARKAIKALNHYLCQHQGKVYLAKDLLLTQEQFEQMYPEHEIFKAVLKEYQSPMRSDLGHRLGLCQ